MKRLMTILAAGVLAFSLAACAKKDDAEKETTRATESTQLTEASSSEEKQENTESETTKADVTTSEAETSATEATTEATAEATTTEAAETSAAHKEVLVVYFSATGTTKDVAEKIAKIEDADLYEIVPAEPYSDADLNWNDSGSRSTKEQNDSSSRPEIGSASVSLEGYKKVYIGYPIWWGEEPRILDTFVESYNFDGITMIPFCTSGGSGLGRSGKNLEERAGSGNWLDGKRFGAGPSEDTLRSWIEDLK